MLRFKRTRLFIYIRHSLVRQTVNSVVKCCCVLAAQGKVTNRAKWFLLKFLTQGSSDRYCLGLIPQLAIHVTASLSKKYNAYIPQDTLHSWRAASLNSPFCLLFVSIMENDCPIKSSKLLKSPLRYLAHFAHCNLLGSSVHVIFFLFILTAGKYNTALTSAVVMSSKYAMCTVCFILSICKSVWLWICSLV